MAVEERSKQESVFSSFDINKVREGRAEGKSSIDSLISKGMQEYDMGQYINQVAQQAKSYQDLCEDVNKQLKKTQKVLSESKNGLTYETYSWKQKVLHRLGPWGRKKAMEMGVTKTGVAFTQQRKTLEEMAIALDKRKLEGEQLDGRLESDLKKLQEIYNEGSKKQLEGNKKAGQWRPLAMEAKDKLQRLEEQLAVETDQDKKALLIQQVTELQNEYKSCKDKLEEACDEFTEGILMFECGHDQYKTLQVWGEIIKEQLKNYKGLSIQLNTMKRTMQMTYDRMVWAIQGVDLQNAAVEFIDNVKKTSSEALSSVAMETKKISEKVYEQLKKPITEESKREIALQAIDASKEFREKAIQELYERQEEKSGISTI
ncbi:MAG TPA: hypothetical protein PL110_17215 [Candidatus Eremiobacteraeota bacterium]|nr:MAG: hypothetical protein BWY64_00735 [bacterium ADurb.Bin363]HPZ09841.1 hypothetical protein [Candidatus Eremiobacteraeota bacterium]